ncbi:hypothetical protein R4P08_00165, partial [Rhodococcus sp. IEGM 1408]|nr:hypothetical protein [Rhodococcus sp. IEGM 1408]
ADPATGSASDSSDPATGSLATLTGSVSDSADPATGSASDSSDPATGSLATLTGSAADGTGSGDSVTNITGSANGSTDPATLLTLGSLAAAGIGIGIVVSGGVNLPPLPQIDLGIVCTLPPEAIDFLKSNGSMEQDECEPEEQN